MTVVSPAGGTTVATARRGSAITQMSTGGSASGEWRAAHPFPARVAGLPASVLGELGAQDAWVRGEQLLDLDEWLAAEGAALADRLHELIGRASHAPVRPRLIGLRRALHGVKSPGRAECDATVLATLPPQVVGRLHTWRHRLAQRQHLRAELPAMLVADRESAVAGLRQAAARPELRRALSQSSPILLDDLEAWLGDERRRPKSQKLLRLAKYVVRAATKTSPYSTFTISGFGTWTGDGQAVRFAQLLEPCCLLELDGTYLQALVIALARHPALTAAARVRVNPSLTTSGTSAAFVGRPPAEPIVTVHLTPALESCLRLVGERGCGLGALHTALAEASGGQEAAQVRRFIDRLLDAGLLEVHTAVPDLAVDPLGALAEWLDANADGRLTEVVKLIGDVRTELLRDVAVADVSGHRARQVELQAAAGRLAQQLDLPPSALPAEPGAVFHEAAVARDAMVRCAFPRWRPALDDLDVVRRWLALLDWKLPGRLALGTYVGERFGAGARLPFVALYRAVQETFAAHGDGAAAGQLRSLLGPSSRPWAPGLAENPLPRLRALHALRTEARRAGLAAPHEDGVVRLQATDLARQAVDWPPWVQRPSSVACYVHARADHGGLQLVLNTMHGGHGRGRGRLRYLAARADGSAMPGPDVDSPPAQSALAELGGLLSSTLNLRAPSVSYEIDYPFTVSGRAVEERIPLRDLVAVHDPDLDLVQLISGRLDAPVTPLHLGMSSDLRLPPAAQFLERAFGSAYLVHPSAPPLLPDDELPVPAGIVHHPRVEVGQMVLQRARWVVPGAELPVRSPGDADADHLLRLAAWLRRHGIPRQCFVRVWGEQVGGEPAKARKPVYVDFGNGLLATAFERQARAADLVLFDEALPAPDDLDAEGAAQPRVAEFLVELSDGPDDV